MTQAWDFVSASDLWQIRNSVLDMLVDDMDMSIRSCHCLLNADIRTVEELISCTQYDLMRIPNLGRKSLREIRETLAMHRLALAGETVP